MGSSGGNVSGRISSNGSGGGVTTLPAKSGSLMGTGFGRLWVGDFVSNLGTSMMVFAVPVIGATMLNLSATEVSWVVAAELSAPLFMALSAGAIADRANRALLMHLCNLGRFVIFAVILGLLLAGGLSWVTLAAALFLVGFLTLLYESSMTAAVPALVPVSGLIRANSWIEGGLSATTSGGPVLAGVLIKIIGAPFIVVFNALSYIFASLMLLGLPLNREGAGEDTDAPATREGENERGQHKGSYTFKQHLQDIKAGFAVLWKEVPPRVVVLAATAYNFFGSWILAIFAFYAITAMNITPELLGAVFVLPAAAGIIASVFTDRLAGRAAIGKILITSFCIMGVAGIAFPLVTLSGGVPAVILFSVVFTILEVCIVINLIIDRSMMQAIFPEEYLSRITGTVRFISWGVDPIGALLGGAFAALVGTQAAIFIGGFGLVLPGLIALSSRQLRSFKSF